MILKQLADQLLEQFRENNMKVLNKTLALLIAILPSTIMRGEGDSLNIPKASQLEFIKSEFKSTYFNNPALLNNWSYSNYADISVSYNKESGEYRDLQKYNKLKSLTISTESVMKMNKGWAFYGRFGYINGKSENTQMNLSYNNERQGSPYYYIMKTPGNWSFQTYMFEGLFSKEIVKNKIYIGGSILFYSNLNFRTIDYRNEQYGLVINVNPSITYKSKQYGTFTYTFNYLRDKTEPEIYSKYQHANDDDKYMMYINTGLGSYIKNAPSSTTFLTQKIGSTIAWNYNWKKSNLSIRYSIGIQEEKLDNKMTSSISANSSQIGKYTLLENTLHINYLYNINQNSIVKAEMLTTFYNGEAKQYLPEVSRYIKNYTSSIIEGQYKLFLFKKRGLVNKVEINSELNNSSQFDLNYGQKIDLTNVKVNTSANFRIISNNKSELIAGIGYGFKKNLDLLHKPLSALDNMVTQSIIFPKLNYLTSEYNQISGKIQYTKQIRKKYYGTFEINAFYTKPFNIIYPDPYHTIKTSQNFNKFDITLRFNF